jgi:hypothetical protein
MVAHPTPGVAAIAEHGPGARAARPRALDRAGPPPSPDGGRFADGSAGLRPAAGTAPMISRFQPTSPRPSCRPTHPSSTPSSGSGCTSRSASSRTACGPPTTTSSTPAAVPGPPSAPRPAASAHSAPTTGPRSRLSGVGITPVHRTI